MSEQNNTQVASALRRAALLLQDEEWEKADEYAEKVLDLDPENPDAYLCKLLSEFHVKRKEELSDMEEEISQSKNYINALKYSDANQKKFLEDCARAAHERFEERERKKSAQDTIKTFSNVIETYRYTQRSNDMMIKRGRSAAKMYLTVYLLFFVYLAAIIITSSLELGGETASLLVSGLGMGLGYPTFLVLLWIADARVMRFWDLDYGDDRGWIFPIFFAMINAPFALGIWGFVKSIKALKECKGLAANNAEMDRQIADLQNSIEEEKARIK